MNRHIAVAAIVVLAVAGCSGGGGGDFQVTTFQDGVNQGTTSIQSRACEKTDFVASVKDGKLTWSTTIKNATNKSVYTLGLLTVVTDANATIYVDFGCSMDTAKVRQDRKETPEMRIGETDAVIEGMPKTWKIVNTHMIVIPPAGCVTCTCAVPCKGKKCKGVLANWPDTPFFARHRIENFKPTVVEKDLGPYTCKIDNLLSETTNNKLVKVSFDLVNEAKVEVEFRIEVTAVTNDGRVDKRLFAYSLKAGERKADIKCDLGFDKEFKEVTTNVSVNDTVKASKKTKK